MTDYILIKNLLEKGISHRNIQKIYKKKYKFLISFSTIQKAQKLSYNELEKYNLIPKKFYNIYFKKTYFFNKKYQPYTKYSINRKNNFSNQVE